MQLRALPPGSHRARVLARRRVRRLRRGAILGAVATVAACVSTVLIPTAANAARIHSVVVGGNGRITAAWSPVAGATGYLVAVSTSPSMNGAVVHRTSGRTQATAVPGLANDRPYYVQVSATGRSAATGVVQRTTTSAQRPRTVSGVTVHALDRRRIRVTWQGSGPTNRIAVLADRAADAGTDAFSSTWWPATTRSIVLTVPESVWRAVVASGDGRLLVRVLQSNRTQETAAPTPQPTDSPLVRTSPPVVSSVPTASDSASVTPRPTASALPTPTLSATPSTSDSSDPTPSATATATSSPAPDPDFAHLSASDFGATGDGRTDDQGALDAAVRAAKAAGKPLYLPPGTYIHSSQLVLDGVVLYGSSTARTILKGTTVGNHAVLLTGAKPGVVNVTVEGPGKAPRTSIRSGNGVYVNYATDYLIRNVHIQDVSGAGVMVENSSGGTERNNLVERTGADGMYHTEGSHDITIAYNRTVATGDDGISVTSYSKDTHDIVIEHNSVVGNFESRAVTVNGTSGGIVIRNNYIDGGTSGISCTSYSGWSGAQTNNVQAYGNTIKNINQTRHDTGTIGGGAISFWNDNTGTDSGTSIHDNQIVNPGLYGIFAGGGSPIIANVTNNRIYMGGQAFRSDNGRASIGQGGDLVSSMNAYPGDQVHSDVGGLDPDYRYAP